MRRLFLKIFLWFWATVALTGISLVLAFILQPQGVASRWHASLADTTRVFGAAAVAALDQGGIADASEYIDRLGVDAQIHACIFDAAAKPLAGTSCSEFTAMALHVAKGEPEDFAIRQGFIRMAVPIKRPSGPTYIYASELVAGPRAALGTDPAVVVLRGGLALIVSGLVCYFLTLYLTAPILRLRSAALQITGGQLSVRAERTMESRRDELGDLVCAFNQMADKTEHLISSQRQLVYDVSHEFRSPLARLNVSLDLLRRRGCEDSALNRMETDLRMLNEMIGRLLTVAKLEATSTLHAPLQVDLNSLLESVVGDAEFEAQERGIHFEVVQSADLFVLGEPTLLRSAIENVLRNAVRYSHTGTTVEALLGPDPAITTSEAILVIRDHGPGVPEGELANIFTPFYRVSNSRSQETGGVGLGLAIAERIVRLHRGSIRALNRPDGGLQVEIRFPRVFQRPG
jgi:two-component system, OmpR family, sensor histidine kinase CpxA